MNYSDPRQCWRCGGLHVGRCAHNTGQTREQMAQRLNEFLETYAARIGGTPKSRMVLDMRER